MFIRWVLPILALVGFISAVRVVISSSKPVLPAPAVSKPSVSPYQNYIAGAGIVEASSENIAISTNISGVVSQVLVTPGQSVKTGDPLFKIDDRQSLASLQVEMAAASAAEAEFANAQDMYDRRLKMKGGALSAEELSRNKYSVLAAEARFNQAKAQVEFRKTEIQRLTVSSPIDGQVLQSKIRVGEYALASALSQPLMIIGSISPMHVRVDIDENDAWQIKDGSKAKAFLRGNIAFNSDLEFVRTEPYVIPKKSLTGESSERVDTRVLQVIYRITNPNFIVFAGQLLDIYIDTGSPKK